MSADDIEGIVWSVVFIIAAGLFFTFGFMTGVSTMQQSAVKNGTAEWIADEKGNPQFNWKVQDEQK
jgi:hypothetical protein